MKIIQFIVNIEKGDAIGNFTLILDDVIKSAGYKSEIYAQRVGKGIEHGSVKSISKLKNVNLDDILIYQMCEGNPISEIIRNLSCKKIAIYHNATPAHFFSRWGKFMFEHQKKSIQEIQSLNHVFDCCIADSEFNKQDLVDMGYDEHKIDVIPIITDFDDYKRTPSPNIIKKYNDGYVNILFVGRIVPNKKQEDIIRAFAYYKKHINEKSRLILVGSPFTIDYYQDLLRYIQILDIEDVLIPGSVPFEDILGYYSVADVFLCMSEHEGFCVPLLESMLFKVPIIAYNSTAIPYTLGESGILIDSKNPVLVAKLIDEVINNNRLKGNILNKQDSKLNEYERKTLEKQFMGVIEKIKGVE